MFNTPILFLIFNRPDTTKKVFGKIREMRPTQLFIAADGPREGNEFDGFSCKEAREIVANVDWDCEVRTLFRDENHGCGKAVSGAITWFFEHVEMGIILEDDVLPTSSFFSFCEELLISYKDDDGVMHISGGCYLPPKFFSNDSYYYTKYPFCWGWATWKRAWKEFSYDVKICENDLQQYGMSKVELIYWLNIKNLIIQGLLDTWAFRWNFSIWLKAGKVICSTRNLVKNIGFGAHATHTLSNNFYYDKVSVSEVEKITHPKLQNIDKKADCLVFKRYNLLEISIQDRITLKIKKWVTSISQFG